MMLTPWRIYCEGERLRGVLKHSWLENQIAETSAEEAVEWSLQPGGWPTLEAESDVRLQQARELAERLDDLFSPAGLIDLCSPFMALDDATRHLVREAVHTAYLKSSSIQALCQPLLVAAASLENALRLFRESCRS